jgi:DNA polymerase-3 subunit delta
MLALKQRDDGLKMLYLLYGSDTFSRREALTDLKKSLDADGMLETNTVVLPAAQTSLQEVIAACDTVPFLGSHRLIIVEGLLASVKAPRGKRARKAGPSGKEEGGAASADAGPWQALAEYASRMPPTTVLVLVDGDVPGGNPLLAALGAKGSARRFSLPDPKRRGAAAGWVMNRARKTGVDLDSRAAALLEELIGNDTWALANELAKLAAYAGGRAVREEDVRALVSAAAEQEVWGLLDAILDGKAVLAARLLHQQLAQGRHPGDLIATIEARYRRLAIARDMLDARASAASIGARTGQSGYGLERLLGRAERYPLAGVRVAIERIVEADAAVKRGLYYEDVSLELLVQDLASASAAASRAA